MSLSTPTDGLLERARLAIRTVERFGYGEIAATEDGTDERRGAKDIVRMAVGLRRMLDRYKENGVANGQEHTG